MKNIVARRKNKMSKARTLEATLAILASFAESLLPSPVKVLKSTNNNLKIFDTPTEKIKTDKDLERLAKAADKRTRKAAKRIKLCQEKS